uniref:Uncharacterized protein n=1 Tax=Onchocerca volvulus TaxID=6282 RepID=A0A8R1XS16_ONCVO
MDSATSHGCADACTFLVAMDVGLQEFIYNDNCSALASTSLKQVSKMELGVLNAMKVEAWIARDSMKKFCTYNETAVLLSRISSYLIV